ncbi:response regulator receiver domain, partial [Salmonella enterica]|uniref:response regulator receiver domain n=1 Tax=Salmonella enterica TaxID=28901 RepID=UPI0020CA92E8
IKNHPFDYQALAEAFAKDGIACCGLLAKSFNIEERDIITASSRKADITILDWDMQSDSGQFAIEIINVFTNNNYTPLVKCIVIFNKKHKKTYQ